MLLNLGYIIRNSLLYKMEQLALGLRKETPTSLELRQLIPLNITPDFVFLWREALRRGHLNPNMALVQAIHQAKSRNSLLLVALALRYGANANMYVATPRIGALHILGHVYVIVTQDLELADLITILLLLSGARSMMPAFDPSGGRIREGEIFHDKVRIKSQTIRDWLLTNINTDNLVGKIEVNIAAALAPDVATQMGILLNDEDLLVQKPLVNDEMDMVITAFADKLLVKELLPSRNQWIFNGLDYAVMEQSISTMNKFALEYLLAEGILPSYPLVNQILMAIATTSSQLIRDAYEEMLLLLIRNGITLDREQIALIGGREGAFMQELLKAYEEPYWKKSCHHKGAIDERLRGLALGLSIDPTLEKPAVCNILREISAAEPDKLVASAVKRQQQRISSNLSLVSEYIDSNPPLLVCRNRTLLQDEPFEYSDLELATYRDEQEVVWCFTSDSFSDLLETGINPYSQQKLPQKFLEELRLQMETLQRLGVNYSNPVPFAKALKHLQEADVIDNRITDKMVAALISLGALNGFTEKELRDLTPERLELALAQIGTYVKLKGLTKNQALAAFAHATNVILRQKPQLSTSLFQTLRS